MLLPPSPWEAMPHPWMCDLHLRSAVSETRPGPGEWLEFDEIPCGLPSLLQSAGRGVATLDVVTDTDTEEAVEAVEYDLIDLAGRRVRLTYDWRGSPLPA